MPAAVNLRFYSSDPRVAQEGEVPNPLYRVASALKIALSRQEVQAPTCLGGLHPQSRARCCLLSTGPQFTIEALPGSREQHPFAPPAGTWGESLGAPTLLWGLAW